MRSSLLTIFLSVQYSIVNCKHNVQQISRTFSSGITENYGHWTATPHFSLAPGLSSYSSTVHCSLFCAEDFGLIQSHLEFFWLVLLVSHLRNHCLIQGFTLIFFFRNFVIVDITLRHVIHFELILVCDIECRSKFSFIWISKFPGKIYWKDNSFPAELSWHFYQKLINNIC